MRAALAIAVALLAAAPAAASETIGRSALTERVRRTAVRAGSIIEALDVQADGTLALVRGSARRSCVTVLSRRAARGRVLACRAVSGDLAIAAGRVLFVQETDRGTRLVLAGPRGRRVLVRPAGRSRAVAGLDLAADRAAWAVGPPGGRYRIMLERL